MNHKPFIVAIGGIIAVAIILILASGPGERVEPPPGNIWTLTCSIPVSNNTVKLASGPGGRISPPPGGVWTLTFSIPASNCPAAFQAKITPQTR